VRRLGRSARGSCGAGGSRPSLARGNRATWVARRRWARLALLSRTIESAPLSAHAFGPELRAPRGKEKPCDDSATHDSLSLWGSSVLDALTKGE
jgi:hypothetical protein